MFLRSTFEYREAKKDKIKVTQLNRKMQIPSIHFVGVLSFENLQKQNRQFLWESLYWTRTVHGRVHGWIHKGCMLKRTSEWE